MISQHGFRIGDDMTHRSVFRLMTTLALAATAIAIHAQTTPPEGKGAQIDETKLEKRTRAVQCVAGQNITLDGVLLDIPLAAIQATGGCRVVIKNSHIKSAAAIQLTDASAATIENSLIEGAVAIQMTDDATASIKSSTIRGRIEKAGAKLTDLGDNKWK
jgi:hypothetical protein